MESRTRAHVKLEFKLLCNVLYTSASYMHYAKASTVAFSLAEDRSVKLMV